MSSQDGFGYITGCYGEREGKFEVKQNCWCRNVMCWCVNCVSVGFAQVWYHVCPNRGKGCYNTRLKRMEDVLFGTTRKRWEHTHTFTWHYMIWTICILIVFRFSCCQKLRNIWNAPLLSVNLTSKYLWMNLMAKWLMAAQDCRGWVYLSGVLFVCFLLFYLLFISVSISSHTPRWSL